MTEEQKRIKKKKDRMLIIVLSITFVFFLFIGTWIGGEISRVIRIRRFTEAISDSTVATYNANSLLVQMDGKNRIYHGEMIYDLYKMLIMPCSNIFTEVPEEDPAVVLNYVDGGKAEIWSVEPSIHTSHNRTVRFRYTSPQGKTWIFETDKFAMFHIEKILQ